MTDQLKTLPARFTLPIGWRRTLVQGSRISFETKTLIAVMNPMGGKAEGQIMMHAMVTRKDGHRPTLNEMSEVRTALFNSTMGRIEENNNVLELGNCYRNLWQRIDFNEYATPADVVTVLAGADDPSRENLVSRETKDGRDATSQDEEEGEAFTSHQKGEEGKTVYSRVDFAQACADFSNEEEESHQEEEGEEETSPAQERFGRLKPIEEGQAHTSFPLVVCGADLVGGQEIQSEEEPSQEEATHLNRLLEKVLEEEDQAKS